MQAWTLFLVSIERGTSRRVDHRRPWLSDTSQLGGAPCWLLARPGCGTRRCVGPTRARISADFPVHAWPAWNGALPSRLVIARRDPGVFSPRGGVGLSPPSMSSSGLIPVYSIPGADASRTG